MIKKLTRTAKLIVHPPDSKNGIDCRVTVVASEYKETELDLCVDYKSAMDLVLSIVYENQLADTRRRLYKH